MTPLENTPNQPMPPQFTVEQFGLLKELEKIKGGFHLDGMLHGAIRALREEDNPESFVHASQSARELIEKFEHAMHGLTSTALDEAGRDNFKDRMEGLGKKWNSAKTGSGAFHKGIWQGKVDAPLGGFLDATEEFFNWYARHDIYRKNKESAVVLRLDPMFSALSQTDQKRLTREWVELRKFFNSVAHHREEGVTKEKMEEALARLVRYLHRRLAPVDAENKEAIRAHIKVWEKHGVIDDAVTGLPELLNSGADAAFFFASIQSADWLRVLRRAGYFSSPPPPVPKGDTELHPQWPQSRFLLKIAGAAPAEVAATLEAMPDTKNLNVNDDIFRAAAALPPEHVGRVVGRVHRWIKVSGLRWRSEDLGKLIRSAAGSGNIKGALGILQDVLAFKPGEVLASEKPKRGSRFAWTPEPTTRLESHEYGELLKSVLPTLAKASGLKTLAALCRILDGYVCARGRGGRGRGDDGSIYWRPSIDESDQNHSFDEGTELISATRRVGDDEIKASQLTLSEVLGVTKDFPWDLFRRLEMHWMRGALDQTSPAMLKAMLVKRQTLRSDRFELEYGLLLQAGFHQLNIRDRKAILRWIADGPNMGPGKPLKPGTKLARQAIEWADRWRMKKWYWVREALPAALRRKYDRLASKGWETEHPGYHIWSGEFKEVVRQSPVALANFRALSLPKQADYLRTWVPTGDTWGGPSRDGLAGIFQAAVAQDVGTYVEQARQFIGVAPEFIGAYFSALWEKLKEGAPRPMAAVWELARWMLQQPDDEVALLDEYTRQTRAGRRWHSARLSLARLLNSLLRSETNSLPISDRMKVWSLIESLASDPDPTVHARAEQGNDENNMGPFTHSLNTVRGESFHAVFEYIAWCRRAPSKNESKGLPLETKHLLERHLDPAVEPTLTIRSVYGANINRLAAWAPPWLGQHRGKIFPGAAHRKFDAVAWTTFITLARPYLDVLVLMPEEFRRAIHEMEAPKSANPRSDPRVRLGTHLLTHYWAGHLGFTSPDDLLAEFFVRAPDEVRAGVISFIGRSLKSTAEPIAPVVLRRLRALWEWRITTARGSGKEHRAEMGGFAWWFDSGKLDLKWSAEQMLEALALSRRHENQFLWMKRYAEIAETETALAVRGLELTVEITREAAVTLWNDEEAIIILRLGLKSADPDVANRAKRVRDAFLPEGKNQFLDLS